MATDELAATFAGLAAEDWAEALAAVGSAARWLATAVPGDARIDRVVAELVRLAGHSKWEIRRAVANAAGQVLHPAFEAALSKLALDDNARVRHAAERASLRRRDWQNASTLGRQHEERINATLDDIEARFGIKGREAVKRASAEMANTFAREIYHEVIKLLSPIAMSVERFHEKVSGDNPEGSVAIPELAKEAARIGHRLGHLRAVLDSMRAYTDQPRLMFGVHSLPEVVEEAVSLVRETERGNRPRAGIVVTGEADVALSIARDRFIQALSNVLFNAVESYDGKTPPYAPVEVTYRFKNEHLEISITDFGCGMSEEVLKDAPVLFATSKAGGTGFGLPLAIKIIESEHGGRLTIESAKGRGTTVHILLPPSSLQRAAR